MSQREYYIDSINNFIVADEENVLGQLLIHDEFETSDLQKLAWKAEIQIVSWRNSVEMLFLSIQYLEWDIELIQYVLSKESFSFLSSRWEITNTKKLR